LSDRAEQGPVVVGKLRSVCLSIQYGQLVAQDDDFEVLGAARTNRQSSHRREETVQDTKHEASMIGEHRAWSTHTAEYRARTRPVEGTRQHGEDRAVSGCESWAIELSLENEDLMAKSQDLRVSLVAGHHQQPEPSDQ
jgi:hypothetical protein